MDIWIGFIFLVIMNDAAMLVYKFFGFCSFVDIMPTFLLGYS